MSASAVRPDTATLRAFLLGDLTQERLAAVEVWLAADPAAWENLKQLSAADDFTETLHEAADLPPTPSDSVDHLVRETVGRVHDTLHSTIARHHHQRTDACGGPGVPSEDAPPGTADLPPWMPASLGGFRLQRELGHGGMGYVFEAEDEKLRRRVAVKVLHPKLRDRPDAVERFLREARSAAAIEHDHVVPVLHVDEKEGLPFIVLPLLKGESLDKRLLREGKLPGGEVARIGRDVAAGLAAAHAQGMIHRDLKPSNVWLDEGTGRARLLDFGLARLAEGDDPLTQSGALVGTPAYMAPEQVDGLKLDARTDLFALGATLYECATGTKPFDGPTLTAILKAVSEHQPPKPAEVPAALADLILRLLAKDPARRPASAAEVGQSLASLQTTVSLPGRPRRLARPRRLLRVASVLGVLLVAVGLYVVVQPEGGVRKGLDEIPQPKVLGLPAPPPLPPARYQGKVDVLVERTVEGTPRLLRLNEPGALPLRTSDKFRIEGQVEPPAYLYVVWVDPDHDVTPVFPWDPRQGWGSRPVKEAPVGKISLPENVGNRYTAPQAQPGVATIVLFARDTPLEVPDDTVKAWFEKLPELPLPAGGASAAVWFDDFLEVLDPLRLRTFGEVGSDDAFARWQGTLQKTLGGRVRFQTAVSFARTGKKP